MQHTLIAPQSPGEQLAALAAGALDMASRQQTGNIGSVTIPTAGGTKLIAGEAAGLQGIAPWVGDTTPPGMPTGVGVDSAAGMILVSWDGTLKGGMPADFDHISILVDGTEAGQLRVRGTATLGPYEADSVHRVTARAWDDAHAEDGSPAPNGSGTTEPVSVTVKSVVDASQIKDAQDKAQQAINQIAGVQQTAASASQAAADAGKAAADAGSTASQAKTIADGLSGSVGTAVSTANNAAASAKQASKDAGDAKQKAGEAVDSASTAVSQSAAASSKADAALSRGVELVRNPAFDPAWGDLDGFGLNMGTSGAPAKPPLPYATYGALTQRDYFSSWRFPLDRGRRYRFGFWCICDGKGREDLRIGWRYVNPGTHWDEAVTVTPGEASSWVWREAVVGTPDQWTDTDHSLSVWLNIAGYGEAAKGWWITGLTVRDVTDSQAAKDQARQAQTTADGKNRIIAAASEPDHAGLALGDLWMQLDKSNNVTGIQVWNGKSFTDYVLLAQQVLVAGSVGTICLADGAVVADKVTASEAMLEKLLVRKIKADEIDVGSLTAAIVESGLFSTPDGLVGFDSSGFWAKGRDGKYLFRASGDGVQAVGGFQTASKGDRIQLSQTLIQGSTTGGLQGIGDDPTHPYWLIWGDHDGAGSRLAMGTSPQQPEFQARITPSGSAASVMASQIDLGMPGDSLRLQGVDASSADYRTNDVIAFYQGFTNYRNFMRIYQRAGVCFLDFNVQKISGLFQQNVLTPVIVLSKPVRPDRAIDMWAYGSYSTLCRVHIFGPNESYPQGTVSVTAQGGQVDYCSGQCFWM
ncbi:hypothetical protein J3U01_01725 [Bifidobacterium sp. B4107]|uniref:hypothetical protein n=1 Tax=unclassified Bifidobacterium TaxID=2608897 RepID=UPI00226B9B2A|nr:MULTISPECIES: hypothetical protein [unclassified Bifidobacterium]MCX8647141.1 hypothetical protein [Bifidobacterium sp. B4107]MCX8651321.1 hypothetical protein [Bifidobacterium sp. B4111]MCX8657751.1 hypothetical protein [Bifidobacterium sp. B4114]